MSTDLLKQLRLKAQANPQQIALPEATEEKILQAARAVLDAKIAYPVLVGNTQDIKAAANSFNISLDGMKIYDNTCVDSIEPYLTKFITLKPENTIKMAKRMAKDTMYYAMILEEIGEIDAVVVGLTRTTAEVILSAQMIIGMKDGISLISSVGIWDIPNYSGLEGQLLAHADCAVNPNPTAEELADIAIASADTMKKLLGWIPRVAMLSFSSKGSTINEYSLKVINATEIANKKRPDLAIEGEFQLDTAINSDIAAKKIQGESKVAGKANILIFPNLDSGNIGVKLLQQFAGANAIGPLLQGFAKPISDLSRSHSYEGIVGVISMVSVIAGGSDET